MRNSRNNYENNLKHKAYFGNVVYENNKSIYKKYGRIKQ